MVKSLELTSPIHGSHGKSAAMAFTINLAMDGKAVQINTIYVMTFNDTGKIVDMKAYWGATDIIEL